MTMTATPDDIFTGNSTLPLASARQQIRCKGKRRNGEPCNQLLLIVDHDLIALDVAARVEGRCPRCATVYTLAEYR